MALLATKLDWEHFRHILEDYGLRLYLVTIPITAVSWLVYVLRWWVLLSPLGCEASFGKLVEDSLIGLFYGLFVPTGLAGDAVRALRFGNRRKAKRAAWLSVAVDRVVGLFSVVLLFGVLLLIRSPEWLGLRFSWISWLIIAILGLSLIGIAGGSLFFRDALFIWLSKLRQGRLLQRRVPQWLLAQIERIWDTLQDYSQGRTALGLSVFISILYQLLLTGVYYAAGNVLGIQVAFGDYIWIVALVTLAQILPVTIAGLGVREGLFAFLLGQYGTSPETAVALSLVVFSGTLLFGALGGLLELVNTLTSIE